ncbi:MAG: FAD-dependent monooxygenase [Acidobacteriota bacterium]
MSKVVIIGAGLAGSLLAIYLAKRGMEVDIFEARGDMRKEDVDAGRSINLALSDRGIAALREVGMDEYMLAEAVPMYGRMIHSVSGETKLLPYSGREGEFINSVSRAGLNIALINEAEKYPGVQFLFDQKCVDFDSASGEVMFDTGSSRRACTVFATDGAGSVVRQSMEQQLPNFNMSSVFLEHGYKELHIPPGHDGSFQLAKNALHIWPRHKFMMIALPNSDGSFTCTLFLAHKGTPPYEGGVDAASAYGAVLSQQSRRFDERSSFDKLTDADRLLSFFDREFSDAVPLMPTLVNDFFNNPTGQLGTVKCWPWNVEGKALLLGDSAHAVVPFYGQGMNCAFEDVRELDSLLSAPPAVAGVSDLSVPPAVAGGSDLSAPPAVAGGSDLSVPPAVAGGSVNWKAVYERYGELRKVNTDAIADMAEENFYEMRDATADPVFQRKRELETKLEQTYPDYFSKYSMVTFRADLPYSIAKERGNEQDRLLMELCSQTDDVSGVNLDKLMAEIRKL